MLTNVQTRPRDDGGPRSLGHGAQPTIEDSCAVGQFVISEVVTCPACGGIGAAVPADGLPAQARRSTSADSTMLSATIGVATDGDLADVDTRDAATQAGNPGGRDGGAGDVQEGGLTGFARRAVEQTRLHLARSRAVGGTDAVAHLAQARALLDAALDEVMAEALLDGASMRAVAERAGIAPNTVPPRLGRTVTLGAYRGEDGRVLAEGIVRARYERSLTRLASSLLRKGESPTKRDSSTDNADPLRFRRRGA